MESIGKSKYWEQPFTFKRIRKRLGTVGKIFNRETKEVMDAEFVGKTDEAVVDKEPFVKIFNGLPKLLPEMTSTGIKIFSYMITRLSADRDFIILNPEDIMEHTGIGTKQEVYAGIKNLRNLDLLCPSKVSMIYFINPAYIFNGDRTEGLKKYLGDSSESLHGWEDWHAQIVSKLEADAYLHGLSRGQAMFVPQVEESAELYWVGVDGIDDGYLQPA